MHILIAPDSFKESLSAQEVAESIKIGFQKTLRNTSFDLLPLGDGGEGTIACLSENLGFQKKTAIVTGPFGLPATMTYAVKDDTAMFEVAELIGLEKIPLVKRDPLQIETRGIGELLLHLAQEEYKKIFIGVGGTSSNDGGIGLAVGLGYIFYDQAGNELPGMGYSLGNVNSYSQTKMVSVFKNLEIKVLVDVDAVLCGPNGATKVFSAQKGLSYEKQERVDREMHHFYQLINKDLLYVKGVGAGGGLAAGLIAFAGASLVSGIDCVLDLLDFDSRVKEADLVIVGEGCFDRQSLQGKTPIGIARRTPKEIPVIAICGCLGTNLPNFPIENIQAVFPIIGQVEDLATTLGHARNNLIRTAENIGSLLNLKKKR
ncbi:Glycerate kinase [Streptococcus sp. DD10]|uniref:glycerate kinase n=1 Tax=Streptococcus sp. DD10 TaxID=1777878 RepID=UPI000795FC70|nr:glycerate kinase [Streptococcus sp. DD10]KXT77160.1 Glycerate kinase [Streptococcus sp. DD10]